MVKSITLASMALAAAVSNAAVLNFPSLRSRQNGGMQQTVYWGQGSGEKSLQETCSSSEGIDNIVLAFLSNFGNGVTPNGQVSDCVIDSSGNGSGCDDITSGINACQAAGKKVFISLGGALGQYSVASQQDGETLAGQLWNAYASPNATDGSVPRPFGNARVDGWDFDIEQPTGQENYQYLISALRKKFTSDPTHSYYISGAPQCPIPEPNMGPIIATSEFDYLWIQFYNNPPCSANDLSTFNIGAWPAYAAKGPSTNVQLMVGLPASPHASTGTSSGAKYFIPGDKLPSVVNAAQNATGFAGVMLWDAAEAVTQNINGCDYNQEVRKVLDTGSGC